MTLVGGPPGSSIQPGAWTRAVWWAAVVVAAVILLDGLRHTRADVRRLSSAPTVAAANRSSAVYSCLEGRLRAEIPLGARVFDASASPLYYQRIIESLSPGYVISATETEADYRVTIVRGTECGSHSVRVTKAR